MTLAARKVTLLSMQVHALVCHADDGPLFVRLRKACAPLPNSRARVNV